MANINIDKTKGTENYLSAFGDPDAISGSYKKDSRLAKAYEVALDIRKFEIELYWKRSGSFWLLVGGIAAALGFLLSSKVDTTAALSVKAKEFVAFVLALAGCTVSYAWYLVNEGSKFWQRNWEYQVDILEQRILGPLYKTVFAKKNSTMYSVSKINIVVSLYFMGIFAVATIYFLLGAECLGEISQSITAMLSSRGWSISNEVFLIAIKSLFLLVNVVLALWQARKVSSRVDRTNKFDISAESSLREVVIDGLYASDEAVKNWDAPRHP